MAISVILPLILMFVQASDGVLSYKKCWKISSLRGACEIRCQDRGFTEIPTDRRNNITCCYRLELYKNKIQIIPDNVFNGMNALTELSLSANKIENISNGAFSGLSNLLDLHLEDNRIQKIADGAFHDLHKLNRLFLDNNQLRRMSHNTWIGLNSLTHLYLNRNQLQVIPAGTFRKLTELSYLDVMMNAIQNIEDGAFSGLQKLGTLSLQHNQLRNITENTLAGLKSVWRINLQANNLTYISPKAWKGMANLKDLALGFQRTKGKLILPAKMFSDVMKRYRKNGIRLSLFMEDTSFNCTCDMYWLVHLINKGTLPDGSKFPLFYWGKDSHYRGTTCGTRNIDDKVFFQSLQKKCQKSTSKIN